MVGAKGTVKDQLHGTSQNPIFVLATHCDGAFSPCKDKSFCFQIVPKLFLVHNKFSNSLVQVKHCSIVTNLFQVDRYGMIFTA